MVKSVKEQIKSIIAQKSATMKQVADFLEKKTNKNYSLSNLSAKLSRETLSYKEVSMIADYLGFDIEFKERNSL